MEHSEVLRSRQAALGAFLKLRRAHLRPQDLGMPGHGRRHVKGLRREEIAEAAGIGSSWYTLLEQGRAPNVSSNALARVADALRLSEPERLHLFDLARHPLAPFDNDMPEAGAAVVRYVRGHRQGPAMLFDRYFWIVAWNVEADEIFELSARDGGNFIERLACDAAFQRVFVEPDAAAVLRVAIGRARAASAVYPSAAFAKMIGRLGCESARFATMWNENPIGPDLDGRYRIDSPRRGERRLEAITFLTPTADGHTVVVMMT